ncbi:MAG: DUF1836 domain-containing protein [Lachnospiraceae bacterium]|nr:DUF1836 domain-containing protein [Lachnospiraceae bacterium]
MSLQNEMEAIIEAMNGVPAMRPEDIPDIGLYMDQVTTLMEKALGQGRRGPEDKILTKTMINNYTKNELLPPPDKKKYSRDHVLLLFLIYYLKNFLSITDIRTLLAPLFRHLGRPQEALSLEEIFSQILSMEEAQAPVLREDLFTKADASRACIDGLESQPDPDYLEKLYYICALSYDIYVKKAMVERLIDNLAAADPSPKGKARKKPHEE